MPEIVLTGSLFVHAAALTQVLGFMSTDQRVLRPLIILGSLLYILYYLFAADTPLWDAIFWSSVIGVVNLVVLLQLMRDRRPKNLSQEAATFHATFSDLTPGDARRLTRAAVHRQSETPVTLTREGEPPRALYFICSGTQEITKGERTKTSQTQGFIGEISLLMGGSATATVVLPQGGVWMEWSHATLERMARRKPRASAELRNLLTTDMARKVSRIV